MDNNTPLPWNTNSPDETLILGSDRQIVATTLQDEDDYQVNYDRRSADANLIVTAVNTYPAVDGLVKALEDSRLLAVRCCDDPLMAKIDSALSRFREAQAGGGA